MAGSRGSGCGGALHRSVGDFDWMGEMTENKGKIARLLAKKCPVVGSGQARRMRRACPEPTTGHFFASNLAIFPLFSVISPIQSKSPTLRCSAPPHPLPLLPAMY